MTATPASRTDHVVSLGSINLDRIRHASDAEIEALEARYDWFPTRGRTVRVDHVPDEFSAEPDRTRHGGKGANQAVAAATAGAGTTLLGKVGPDHDDFDLLDPLREAGVDIDRVDMSTTPTGTTDVFVDPTGDNRIIVNPGANGSVDAEYVLEQYDTIRSAECLVLQNEIPTEPVASLLSDLERERDRPIVVLDPAPPEGVETLLEEGAIDYLTPNESEYRTLQPSIDAFDGVVVRKRGPDPVVVETDPPFAVTPPTVDVVDTTGAGDVLNGFFAARLAAGASLGDAVEFGTIAGSLATREAGARNGRPTLEDVRQYRTSDDEG